MFTNYLKIALRSFRRHKAFTFINVIGLALGICCALLIYMLVSLHTSFDAYHSQADNTYRLATDLYYGGLTRTPGVPRPFPKAVREDMPQVDKVAAVDAMWGIVVTVEENGEKKKYHEDDLQGAYVEPEYFDIFDYEWISGKPASLSEPNKAVITKSTAEMLFGSRDPIGQQVRIDNEFDFFITGVVGDIPENTDMRAKVFCSYATTFQDEDQKKDLQVWGGGEQ